MGIQMLEAVAAAIVVIALSIWAADFGLSRDRR
jgi:preprotein translocase subunit SecE